LGEPTAHARLPAGAAEMIDCDGLLVFLDGQLVLCEADVSAEEAETLRAAAAPLVSQTQFATESMVRYFDQSDDLARRASGLLYERGLIGRPRARRLEICWLRPEKTVAVHWAGRPEKGERVEDGTVRISPRQSFEKWTSLSRATAEPWRQSDLLLANRLMLRAMTRANHVP
jgi:chemotaxis family two-component system sensor kinase Cph1